MRHLPRRISNSLSEFPPGSEGCRHGQAAAGLAVSAGLIIGAKLLVCATLLRDASAWLDFRGAHFVRWVCPEVDQPVTIRRCCAASVQATWKDFQSSPREQGGVHQ